MKNKYFKTTQGLEAIVFVANGVSYTSQATFDLFVANAAEGEIGVFYNYKASGPTTYKESVAALVPSNTALAAGDKFFIAQKRDGLIHRTPTSTYSDFTSRQVSYSAPVLQVSNIGYTGTAGTSMNSGTLVSGQIWPIKLIETTPGNQPFPIWDYEDTVLANDTLQSIADRIMVQINSTLSAQNQYNQRLADCNVLSNGTFTAITLGSGNVGVTKGSTTVTATGHNVNVGDYIRIGGTTDTFPVYKVASVSTNSFELTTAYTGATNAAITAANTGKMTAVTEVGFKFTAINYGSHFKIAVQEDIYSATITYTTPYKEGIGTGDQVVQLEIEGQIFSGWTTVNAQFVSDYGQPTSFASSASTYDLFWLDYKKEEKSVAAPRVKDFHYGDFVIAAPHGASPSTAFANIFV